MTNWCSAQRTAHSPRARGRRDAIEVRRKIVKNEQAAEALATTCYGAGILLKLLH